MNKAIENLQNELAVRNGFIQKAIELLEVLQSRYPEESAFLSSYLRSFEFTDHTETVEISLGGGHGTIYVQPHETNSSEVVYSAELEVSFSSEDALINVLGALFDDAKGAEQEPSKTVEAPNSPQSSPQSSATTSNDIDLFREHVLDELRVLQTFIVCNKNNENFINSLVGQISTIANGLSKF